MEKSKTDPSLLSERARQNRSMAKDASFFKYVLGNIRSAALYGHWLRVLAYFRRLRLVAIILRIAGILLTVLQTGALVLLTTVIFLIALPIFVSLMLGILLTALLESRKTNRVLSKLLCGKRIYILFAAEDPTPFFIANAKDLALRPNAAVLIVSPFLLSSKGIFRKRFYCTARREAENIYTLRRYYFFNLRKKVLGDKETAYFY